MSDPQDLKNKDEEIDRIVAEVLGKATPKPADKPADKVEDSAKAVAAEDTPPTLPIIPPERVVVPLADEPVVPASVSPDLIVASGVFMPPVAVDNPAPVSTAAKKEEPKPAPVKEADIPPVVADVPPVVADIPPVVADVAAGPEKEDEDEEDILIYLPKTSVGTAPKDAPVIAPPVVLPDVPAAPTPADPSLDRTRKMPDSIPSAVKIAEEPAAAEEDDPSDQLLLAGFEEDKVDDNADSPDEEMLEDQLRQNREKKVSAFRMRLSGEEEDNDPDEEPEPPKEEEYVEDFTSYDDTDLIRNELDFRFGKSKLTLAGAIILELALLGVTALGRFGLLGSNLAYWILSAVLFAALAILCSHTFQNGWADLADGVPGSDTAAAAGAVLAAVQAIVCFFSLETAAVQSLLPLSGFGLLLGVWARERQLKQVSQNFRFVGHTGTKTVCHRIEDDKVALEIGHDAVASGVPDVAYYRPTPFLSRYLARSYERPDNPHATRIFIPVMAGVALVAAVIFGLLQSDWAGAFRLFVLLFCLGQPFSLRLSSQSAVTRTSARILRAGGLLVNRKDAEDFSHVHALAVDAIELFPGECVLLNGIKTFSGTRIDDAIVDAASVSIAAGGPLSEVFRRIIENKTELLHEVETLTYEQEMGLSGWVNGRRVLVGNRRLLENHGVDVPSRDYELRYSKEDRQLVYLSIAGELSAMFVVTYTRSEVIAKAVHQLAKSHITLLVRTCDQNVTADLICKTLDADEYYIEILGSTARRRYEQLVGQEPTEEPAGIASNGRIEGQAAALTGCRRLTRNLRVIGIAVMVLAIVLFTMTAVTAFLQPLHPLSPFTAVLYHALAAVLLWVLPLVGGS